MRKFREKKGNYAKINTRNFLQKYRFFKKQMTNFAKKLLKFIKRLNFEITRHISKKGIYPRAKLKI